MKALLLAVIFILNVYGINHNKTKDTNATIAAKQAAEKKRLEQIQILKEKNTLLQRLQSIENSAPKGTIWIKKYNNYLTYLKINSEFEGLQTEREKLEKSNKKNKNDEAIADLDIRINTLKRQLEILKEYKDRPFSNLTSIKEINDEPIVDNPIAIINAFSYMKQLEQQKNDYQNHLDQLQDLINNTSLKKELLEKLTDYDKNYQQELESTVVMLDEFKYAMSILETASNIYSKQSDEVIAELTEQITIQIEKSLYIFGIIATLFIIAILIKLANKKYIHDNERLYTANKIVNFVNVTVIIIVLLFAYLENVSYLVTLLGFASAGLAIAMKDLFMSLLGWLVIVFGGSIHVGDRVRVEKDGTIYLGDVLDISLLRITIHEDITLTTYTHNRRAGRIIFIPNNYIFTTLLANYSHSGMKTVWDGIDITISFDSNFKKAVQITKDISKKYSKGYTDITRKQLNRLRDKYSLKNTNVDPRIFTFLEENGIKISVWYLTNSFATLTLRSTISGEIIEEFMKHSDIKIAYPTTTINIKKRDSAMEHGDIKETIEKGLF